MKWIPGEGIHHYERVTKNGERYKYWDFFGSTDRERGGSRPVEVPQVINDEPWVFITGRPPGNVQPPHFHDVPQYQLFVQGHGHLGKHPVGPVTVHYTDGYTPYGPIVASDDEGLSFMTIRNQTSNGGAFFMPESKSRMPHKAGRMLVADAPVKPGAVTAGKVEVEDLIQRTDDGVETKLFSLGAGAVCRDPESAGRDRFLVVISGALMRDGQEYATRACTFLREDEETPELTAGPDGAQVLLLRFGQRVRPVAA